MPKTRRQFLSYTSALLATPTIFPSSAWAGYTNEPTSDSVTFGLNVPQTGAYADEGVEEFRGFELAVEHINAGGGGMNRAGFAGGSNS